ncbi:MAG: hypothetical protein K9M57_10025 [Phycisphaerae bacterium]|nr:hypothetical protein [Phycisphaerae bacterium]
MKYNGELSGEAWFILTAMILLIVGGLSWCFYRAITAANKNQDQEQFPDEV